MLASLQPLPGCRNRSLPPRWTRLRVACASAATDAETPATPTTLLVERGMPFDTGGAFFRAQSAQGRDLAMLCAALHKRETGSLRVLDCMSGSGMRAARFLHHAGAEHVVANDVNPATRIVENLSRVASADRRVDAPSTATQS